MALGGLALFRLFARPLALVLLIAILVSILTVMLNSVAWMRASPTQTFTMVEWGFTLLFTLEYLWRLVCVRRPLRYATSFFSVVDSAGQLLDVLLQ